MPQWVLYRILAAGKIGETKSNICGENEERGGCRSQSSGGDESGYGSS